jgi:hypothetical protein
MSQLCNFRSLIIQLSGEWYQVYPPRVVGKHYRFPFLLLSHASSKTAGLMRCTSKNVY